MAESTDTASTQDRITPREAWMSVVELKQQLEVVTQKYEELRDRQPGENVVHEHLEAHLGSLQKVFVTL